MKKETNHIDDTNKMVTALEWLGYELNTKLFYDLSPKLWEQVDELFKQAKEMEKEQINKACYDGYYKEDEKYTYEYYNETYNK